MRKKSKCKFGCDSSSSSSSSFSCSSSKSSSSYGFCCNKYPKCKCYCVKTKCAPIYYPNNYVGPYPCNPCNPCAPNPCNPCIPNPCKQIPSVCGTPYTSNNQIITTNLILNQTSPNVNIFYNSGTEESPLNITLPPIGGMNCCSNLKMFVISNLYILPGVDSDPSVGLLNIIASGSDLFITGSTTFSVSPGVSVVLYAVYIPSGNSYWVVLPNSPVIP